jgi:hypothetical protein
MATTYKFQVSMPVSDTLTRNRITNTFHLQHVIGALLDTDLESMCQDIVALYQTRYGSTVKEVQCKAYDVDAVPNFPRADVVVNPGAFWACTFPREIALVLSFAGEHKGNRRQRGRLYLMPQIRTGAVASGLRPSAAELAWALEWYGKSNESFPDLGGVDWQFGVWSSTAGQFTKSEQAWVNDDWDVQRRRGLRETTRVQSVREG